MGAGNITSSRTGSPSASRIRSNITASPLFGMNGNGCAGSSACGVRIGKICSRKCVSSQANSSAVTASSIVRELSTVIPVSASNPRNARHTTRWLSTSASASAMIAASCWLEFSPSTDSRSASCICCPLRPATRTMKNSSRFEPEIARKRNRSNNGWAGLHASSSTRRLKPSQLSSRLKKRSAPLPGVNSAGSSMSAGAAGRLMRGSHLIRGHGAGSARRTS